MSKEVFDRSYQYTTDISAGSFVPHKAASIFAWLTDAPNLKPEIVRIMRTPEVADAVYPDVHDILTKMVTNGVSLVIWTQGELVSPDGTLGYQEIKVIESGIPGRLNPGWTNVNGETRMPFIFGGPDKQSSLTEFLSRTDLSPFSQAVVIDDREANVRHAVDELNAVGLTPSGYNIRRHDETLGEAPMKGISVIKSLLEVDPNLFEPTTLALVDLDYTLIDHKKVKTRMQEHLSSLLKQKSSRLT